MVDLTARQVRRQGQPLGLFLLVGGRCLRLRQRVDLAGHGRQVRFDLVFEQALLFGVEALGLGSELHALQERVLVGELVDEGLLEGQFLVLGGSGLQHGQQRRAQLLGTQTLQRLRLDHHGRDCASAGNAAPLAHAPIGRQQACDQIQSTVMTPPSPRRCHGRPSTSASN